MLQDIFSDLFLSYDNNAALCETHWKEIESYYTDRRRYYHNLIHLQHMHEQLALCKAQIEDWHTILFALFYHDIIYKVRGHDNEEQSALLAAKRLTTIHYPKAKIALCSQHILATKNHIFSKSSDTNYFTDADLSILGSSNEAYTLYTQQVRREYAIYPDFLYKPGRKKVLKHFLSMDNIYKTPYFITHFETKARQNILAELQAL